MPFIVTALARIATALAAAVIVLAVMNWQVILIVLAAAALLGLMLKNGIPDTVPDNDNDNDDDDDDDDGMRDGWDGYGEYMNGWKVR